METDESDNITVDMKNPANEYEFQKLNADFDKKLDRLSEEYKRKADEIFHADRYGFDMAKRRNRLWMWFDRKTGYQIIPKIVIISFLVTISLFSALCVLLLRLQHRNAFFGKYGSSLCASWAHAWGRLIRAVSGPSARPAAVIAPAMRS